MLLTTIFPGGGQFYTERYFKGLIIGGAQSYLIYSVVQTQLSLNEMGPENTLSQGELEEKQELLDQRRSLGWWMALVWTIGILDAYVDAQLYGFESKLTLDQRGSPKVELSLNIRY